MRRRGDCGDKKLTERPVQSMAVQSEAAGDPVSFIIFGATGDLTARKLVPALYCLARQGFLPEQYNIVGFARRPWTDEFFREQMFAGIQKHARCKPGDQDESLTWEEFASHIFYVQSPFAEGEGYKRLDNFLKTKTDKLGMPDNRIYYLSAPPSQYEIIIQNLGLSSLTADSEKGWRRIIIEKPFGVDLVSAQVLNEILAGVFTEDQVYRIDHYLGKETVQNILVLRFANAIFEPIWNRQYVDHIQISMAESVGVGTRGGFYDDAGIIRDIFQNHLLQVMSLIAMEPPAAYEANAIRDEKVKVLRAVRQLTPDEVRRNTVRGQYVAGTMPDGEAAIGYLDEDRVAEDSVTPTFGAVRWEIDNWRWQGVPIYLRSGKRMPVRATEVSIHFKSPPHLLFDTMDDEALRGNVLTLRIQPDEGISFQFEAKLPGQGLTRNSVFMDFSYCESFGIMEPPEAYERLLLDSVLGDATLFTRSDEIELAWSLVDPILEMWASDEAPALEDYEAGGWGPPGADELLGRDGRQWRKLTL